MGINAKKLLAISWAMPPLLYPRSIQVARTLKGLNTLGWDSTVVCVKPASIKSSRVDLTLERRYSVHYRTIHVISSEETRTMQVVRKLLFIFNQLPYFQWNWVMNAVTKARQLLTSEQFSALISFAQPWSDHIIGLYVHRLSGLPWVAHFSDPWVDNPFIKYRALQIPFLRRLEATILREADAVVFVSNQTADLVMSKYPYTWRKKVHIIPHSFESLNVEEYLTEKDSKPQKLRMIHIGNLYGMRTPENFFKGLALLNRRLPLVDKYEVSFMGQDLDRFRPLVHKLGLEEIVNLNGPISVDVSRRVCATADVLLVIDAPSEKDSLFLPSKLVDYLAFKRTILGITPLQGASADLLRDLKCPIIAPDNITAIATAVEELLIKWSNHRLTISPEFVRVSSKYDLYQVARRLDGVIRSAMVTNMEDS